MITLEIKNREYKLDIVRRSVKKAEDLGVVIKSAGFGATYDLFYIALLKEQPKITLDKAYELFDLLIDEGEYNPSEVLDILGKQLEEAFSKIDNPNAKKKLLNR